MSNSILSFWNDQRGSIELSSWFFLAVMLALGLLVGLSNIRLELTQQFGDVADALESLDQSYSYTVNNVTSQYQDTGFPAAQVPGSPPAGIDVNIAGQEE